MADFCWRCLADRIYPEHPEHNDLRGLCAEGEMVAVLCEGCGPIYVDHLGKPIAPSSVSGPHLFPREKFPITFRAYRTDNDEKVWERRIGVMDLNPRLRLGGIRIPPLAKEHGVPMRIEVEFADGEIEVGYPEET